MERVMGSIVGSTFTDRSSGIFAITSIKWRGLIKYYVVEIMEAPKEGEPSVADIKMAISHKEFLMTKARYKKLKELGIIKRTKV